MKSGDANREAYFRALSKAEAGRSGLKEALSILRGLLPRVTAARHRGLINQQIWKIERALGLHGAYFSECGQDAWLDANVFKGKPGGTFAEIGGYDGRTGSNCLYFEMMRGWSGVLVEPVADLFQLAAAFRRCRCLSVAVDEVDGESEFFAVRSGLTQMGGLLATHDPAVRQQVAADPRQQGEVIRVPTRPLAKILETADLTDVDYVSLDVEGAELKVLESFPFEAHRVTAWTVENNAGGGEICALMESKGYRLAEAFGMDEVYVKA